MRQNTRRRLSKLTATGFALGIGASYLGLSAPAVAAQSTPAYSASSSANLLHVSALDANPLGINLGPLVDLKLSTSGSSVDSTKTPRSEAAAAQLDLAVGKKLPDVPAAPVRQTAPADNQHPTETDAELINLPGIAKIGLGKLSAHARWNASCEKGDPTNLTNSSASLADVALLPGANLTGPVLPAPISLAGAPVLDLPDVGKTQSRTDIVDVKDQAGHGVQAQSSVSLASLTLFKGTPQQIDIKVVSAPTLTAVAAGSDRSSVKYTSPILDVTVAGTTQRLDSAHANIEIPFPTTDAGQQTKAGEAEAVQDSAKPAAKQTGDAVNGAVQGATGTLTNVAKGGGGSEKTKKPALLRLSLGDLEKTVTPTSVKAEASSLRLQVLDVPGSGTLLDVALGQLKAAATVPNGGLNPGTEPSPSHNAGGSGGSKGSLPVTGSSLTWLLAGGAALAIGGRFMMVLAKRRTTPTA